MTLNPQAQQMVDLVRSWGGPPAAERTIAQMRAADWVWVGYEGEPEPIAGLVDTYIPGPTGELHVRIYTPTGSGPFPALVYFHGGGWTVGNLAISDRPNRSLANALGCVVVAVNYQKAPEHRFPTALDDCYATVEWTLANAAALGVDPAQIGVGGDSAGGNLAAAACLQARAHGVRLAFQLLIYPALDPEMDYPSARDNAEGFGLSTEGMRVFWDLYAPDAEQRANPLAVPFRASTLADLPPAAVVTCGYDPLRDEGRLYADRLEAAGVRVFRHDYDDTIHGFLWMAGALTDDFARLMRDLAEDVRQILTPV